MEGIHTRKARSLVYGYIKNRLEKTDTHVTFLPDQVYVVWFCFTLGNWKCLLSTTLPDGMYYEVTYDKAKECTYIDAYKKFENVSIPDGMSFDADLSAYKSLSSLDEPQKVDLTGTEPDAFDRFLAGEDVAAN